MRDRGVSAPAVPAQHVPPLSSGRVSQRTALTLALLYAKLGISQTWEPTPLQPCTSSEASPPFMNHCRAFRRGSCSLPTVAVRHSNKCGALVPRLHASSGSRASRGGQCLHPLISTLRSEVAAGHACMFTAEPSQDSIAVRSEPWPRPPVPSMTCSSSSTPISSLASSTGLQGRKRGIVLVRHRSFNLHRLIILAPIRVVPIALGSYNHALCGSTNVGHVS
jgi:hypothetical protein